MATPDFFTPDAFGLVQLTAAINEPVPGQAVPNIVDDLFNEEGIATTKVYIERRGNTLSLVPAMPYGSQGSDTTMDRRNVKSFDVIHLPTIGHIWAHEVQGVREFGVENAAQSVETKRDSVLMKMRGRLDATMRYHRIKALQGKIYDADGVTVLLDVFSEFGVQQQTTDLKFSAAATKIKLLMEEAKEKAVDQIGDSTLITGWRCYAGRDWFNQFVTHPLVEDAYNFYQGGQFKIESQAKTPFNMFDIDFFKLYGKVGGVEFIPTAEAYLMPVVADSDNYITRFGPANYVETVNTMGLPYYAKAELMEFGKGIKLEAQSNPLSIPTRPASIIKLTES